jgi:hypothetical protein
MGVSHSAKFMDILRQIWKLLANLKLLLTKTNLLYLAQASQANLGHKNLKLSQMKMNWNMKERDREIHSEAREDKMEVF